MSGPSPPPSLCVNIITILREHRIIALWWHLTQINHHSWAGQEGNKQRMRNPGPQFSTASLSCRLHFRIILSIFLYCLIFCTREFRFLFWNFQLTPATLLLPSRPSLGRLVNDDEFFRNTMCRCNSSTGSSFVSLPDVLLLQRPTVVSCCGSLVWKFISYLFTE